MCHKAFHTHHRGSLGKIVDRRPTVLLVGFVASRKRSQIHGLFRRPKLFRFLTFRLWIQLKAKLKLWLSTSCYFVLPAWSRIAAQARVISRSKSAWFDRCKATEETEDSQAHMRLFTSVCLCAQLRLSSPILRRCAELTVKHSIASCSRAMLSATPMLIGEQDTRWRKTWNCAQVSPFCVPQNLQTKRWI